MIKFIPYKPEHMDELRLRPEFEAQSSVLAFDAGREMAKRMADVGCALTIAGKDDEVLAVCTWVASSPGMIDIGMYASEHIYSQPCSYLRFARRKFKDFLTTISTDAVRRIQTLSFCDEKHDRWMSWLGFQCEGTLKKYAHNGADMRLWAITGV